VVLKGETLYKIAKDNHVYISQVKAWNHLTGDNLKAGEKLIIYTNNPTTNSTTAFIAKDSLHVVRNTIGKKDSLHLAPKNCKKRNT